jgi:hypothetical protein
MGKKDLDKFIDLYQSLGITVKPIKRENGELYIKLDQGDGFIGYGFFYSIIDFDRDGKFISQGFWE